MSTLRLIGYWSESPPIHLGYPDPAVLVADWDHERRTQIANYLASGRVVASYAGYSHCRFASCTHADRERLGTADLSDGEWLWPEGLAHYVRDHGVPLPDELVATAARNRFAAPAVTGEHAVDTSFWLAWVAAHSTPPPAMLGACSVDEARSICAELATQHWRATLAIEHGRWKLAVSSNGTTVTDYSGPITALALRDYLFRGRRPDDAAIISPDRAAAIAAELSPAQRIVKPFAGTASDDGRRWWAVIGTSGTPSRPLDTIDLRKVEIPEPGWATFLPGNWKVEVVPAMDEPAWRFFVERWHRPAPP